MCLVISVLLAALGINFYLNGFYMQAALMAALSVSFIVLMIKNMTCRQKSCGLKKDKHKEDKESTADSLSDTDLE